MLSWDDILINCMKNTRLISCQNDVVTGQVKTMWFLQMQISTAFRVQNNLLCPYQPLPCAVFPSLLSIMAAIKNKKDPHRQMCDLFLWGFSPTSFWFKLFFFFFLLTTKLFHKFKPKARGTIVLGLLEISHRKGSAKESDKVGKGFSKYYLKEIK